MTPSALSASPASDKQASALARHGARPTGRFDPADLASARSAYAGEAMALLQSATSLALAQRAVTQLKATRALLPHELRDVFDDELAQLERRCESLDWMTREIGELREALFRWGEVPRAEYFSSLQREIGGGSGVQDPTLRHQKDVCKELDLLRELYVERVPQSLRVARFSSKAIACTIV